ncbi:MAG: thioredoxin family protein [Candidatus Thermoplasmatota archaeon]
MTDEKFRASYELTDTTFEQFVEQNTYPVLVMFYSPTCPYCAQLDPYFEQYAKEFQGKVFFAKINVADHPRIAAKYHIMGTPTFSFFCSGYISQQNVGAVYPTLIKKMVEDGLSFGIECSKHVTWFNPGITGYV